MSHPEELRNLVINEVENGSSISAALEKYNVSRSSYQRWINLKKETGTAAIPPRNTQPYKVDNVQLRNYIEENPSAYIREIAAHFHLSTGCTSTALKRLKISSKKSMLYAERDEEKRANFKKEISKISSQTLAYIDEAGIDKHLIREYGWGNIGTRVAGEVSGKRYARESFIAAEIDGKLVAPFCYTGTCDSSLFNLWLKTFLLPELKPGTTIVMDNASIHKAEETRLLIEKNQCKLFLPAYSPDLNPIEKVWSRIKSIIRKSITKFKTLADAIDHAFKSIILF